MDNIILQKSAPDCSLASVLNCYILNGGENANRITQDVANKYFESYINKHPKDGFWFLKNQGYNIKYLPVTLVGARNVLKKGRALICRRKYNRNYWIDLQDDWQANGSKPIDIDVGKGGHFFCIRQEGDKVWAYDSNFPKKYIIDWEFFHREGVIGSTFYQIR